MMLPHCTAGKPPPSSPARFESLTTTSLALMLCTWNMPCLDTSLPNFSWWRQTFWNDSWRVLRGLHEHQYSSWQPVDSHFSVFASEASNNQRMKGGTKRLLDITSSSIRQVRVAPCPTRYEPHSLPHHKHIYLAWKPYKMRLKSSNSSAHDDIPDLFVLC